ncbi:MAG TPA: hypothetical protein VLA34_12295, partial [Candidatus Krumholzibacterium sp.]|nr:hypothetical protein [Candidatus Krumholzibacterium sp.]
MNMESSGLLLFTALALDSIVIMALVLMSCRLLSNASASLRHQVVAGAFFAILLLPVLVISMPSWDTTGIMDPLALRGVLGGTATTDNSVRANPRSSDFAGTDPIPVSGVMDISPQSASELTDLSRPPASQDAGETLRPGAVLSSTSSFLRSRMPVILFAVWAVGAASILVVHLVRWAGAGFVAEMSG